MRQRIRNILILMCVCILSIYLFQIYWLYNSYHIQLDQFGKDINESLRTAVFNKQFADVRRYFRRYGREQDSAGPRDMPPPQDEMHEMHRGGVTGMGLRGEAPNRKYADTLARQISDF